MLDEYTMYKHINGYTSKVHTKKLYFNITRLKKKTIDNYQKTN